MVTALLVTSAATLFESAPFILAAVVLTHAPLRWNARVDAYLACGCGAGPSARSLPAAAATCLIFGPLVAGVRLAGAIVVERLQRVRACEHAHAASVLAELHVIAPIAALGAAAALLVPAIVPAHLCAPAAFAAGALAAFLISPCALGAVGFAASLRTLVPAACAGFLCVAGLLDLRVWLRRKPPARTHDAFAYALLGAACACVAARHGAGLVHPKLALALWPCAAAAAYGLWRFRTERCAALRLAPAIMLIGAFVSAPLPAYHATETTLADGFAGEHVDFTGVLTRTGSAATLVRYAITCCRADAAPIVLRLDRTPPNAVHGWIRARGVLVGSESELRLRADALAPVDPPADPFVYR